MCFHNINQHNYWKIVIDWNRVACDIFSPKSLLSFNLLSILAEFQQWLTDEETTNPGKVVNIKKGYIQIHTSA